MIGSREEPVQGLGDIVSNLLALFILLTLFVLLAKVTGDAASELVDRPDDGAEGTSRIVSLDPVTRPPGYVVVTGTGFAVLDMPAILQGLADGPLPGRSTIPGGLFVGDAPDEPATARVLPGDPSRADDHALTAIVAIDVDAVPEGLAVPGEAPAEIVAAIAERTPANAALDFFVFPDGFDRFLPVHDHLAGSGACFRWRPWTRRDTVEAGGDLNPIRIRPFSLRARRKCPA